MDSPEPEIPYVYENMPVIQQIGKGIYGIVYKSVEKDGTPIAIKNFIPIVSEGIDYTTLREIHALYRLIGCDHIVQVRDAEYKIINGFTHVAIKLDYYDGDLRKFYIKVSDVVRLKQFHRLMDQMILALGHLHNRGLLHLDIKSANILVKYQYDTEENGLLGEPQFYLADFGLSYQRACRLEDRIKVNDPHVITPNYRPPEVAFKKYYGEEADVWSLGATLLEYMSGEYLDFRNVDDPELFVGGLVYRLTPPVMLEINTVDDIVEERITGEIDIRKYLLPYLKPFHIQLIDRGDLSKLGRMLEVSPTKRAKIPELLVNHLNACPITLQMPNRGEIKSEELMDVEEGKIERWKLDVSDYYATIRWLINICRGLGCVLKSLVAAIDLTERFIANVDIHSIRELQLVMSSSLLLASKEVDENAIELSDMVYFTQLNIMQMKDTEIAILITMDNMVISCDIDPFLSVLLRASSSQNCYALLTKFYESLNEQNIYSGELSYDELTDHLNELLESS